MAAGAPRRSAHQRRNHNRRKPVTTQLHNPKKGMDPNSTALGGNPNLPTLDIATAMARVNDAVIFTVGAGNQVLQRNYTTISASQFTVISSTRNASGAAVLFGNLPTSNPYGSDGLWEYVSGAGPGTGWSYIDPHVQFALLSATQDVQG